MEKSLTKTKMKLIMAKNAVFLATLALSLKHKFSNEVPTAATDGLSITYNPEFFKSLTDEERVFLLAHEVFHVAFSHMIRRGNRDFKLYNMAGDFVINQVLKDSGYKLIEGSLIDDRFKGMSTAEVYEILAKNPPPESQGFQVDLVEGEEQGKEELETAIKEMLVRAATKAVMEKQQGSIPGDILRGIQDLINPKLNWKQLLERFVSEKAKEDYSWRRPNKRYQDAYLPSLYSETIPEIVVAIDTSGSIGQVELTEMLSEVVYLWKTFNPEKLTVIDFDAEIHGIHTVEHEEDIFSINFKGGGGSDVRPVFKYCEENNSTLVVVFTDMYLYFPEAPETPTLWISYGDDKAPFGELVKYES